MYRRLKLLAFAGLAALGLNSCAPNAQNTAQSIAQEQAAAARFVQQLDAKGALMKDRRLNNYVRGVVSRIAKQRAPGSVPLQAYIIKDATVNAFTPGGGYVFFNAGLVANMENEAQFATVVAHEIAHIDRGHIRAGMATRQNVQLGAVAAMILGAAAGINPNALEPFVGLGASAAVSSFTRQQERDADDMSGRYMAAAGYNLVEGAKSFAVLRRIYGGQSGQLPFLSSHPPTSEREATVTSQARALGAVRGRIGNQSHDRATRSLRRDILEFYESKGRNREAAQIRRELR